MGKKINDLTGGLATRLGGGEDLDLLSTITDENLRERLKARGEIKHAGRPRKGEEKSPSERTTRATFVVKEETLLKIREIALRERIQQKDIISLLFEALIENYEKKNGEIIINE